MLSSKCCLGSFMVGVAILFVACSKDSDDPAIGSLQEYVDQNPQWERTNQLVACAAGGQEGFLEDPDFPISMFFYPKLFSTNFRYYQMDDPMGDTSDLSLFQEHDVSWEPLFNGFMARFPLTPRDDVWGRVSFVSLDTLWYSKPVRFKTNQKPSVFLQDLLEVNPHPTAPILTWPTESDRENIIYFQILADDRGDAVSATYTTDKAFTYGNLSNVVFNVTRPGPLPELTPGKKYRWILMGISADNWVNTLSSKEFTVPIAGSFP
ncbi:MAG: hypothetical protein KTR24_16495 [Saprospiraceae bacterium]|nr:hypothetical protein [Saprospiraceae bacterium]